MSVETVLTILLIVILTFAFGFVLDRWDRRGRGGDTKGCALIFAFTRPAM
jgi:hypothetical protein